MTPFNGENSRSNLNSSYEIDEAEASGILSQVIKDNKVFLGGSSMGKGLRRAARYYIRNHLAKKAAPEHLKFDGASDLNPSLVNSTMVEDSFYVFDLGVIVSQFYQWRNNFPRVEPFYAVKCNPDPIVVRTLAILGANFDCASRNEIRLVQAQSADLPRKPEIIYANPCKARAHMVEAVCKGVRLVTFDNVAEVEKCAAVSKKIQLVMRIITDDRGSQCRLSSKFGAPRHKWRTLMNAAKKHGLEVVGVSFHVGSGCRDASRYEMALKDAREIFDIAENEYGYRMEILDIGGGFPGETHSMYNPADLDADAEDDDDEDDEEEEKTPDGGSFMYFTEIAEKVRPMLDELFPPESGVRLIAEPGRYFVAASASLIASVISTRTNAVDDSFKPDPIDDEKASANLKQITRDEEKAIIRKRGLSFCGSETNQVLDCIVEEMADYSKLFAMQTLSQQEADTYNDPLDLYNGGYDMAQDLLGPPNEEQMRTATHTVEGLNISLVTEDVEDEAMGLLTLAAAGEAAVNGVVIQAVADSAPLQDDYAYYINDGVYGAFNNIMFDHASIRPRQLRHVSSSTAKRVVATMEDDFLTLESPNEPDHYSDDEAAKTLYASTIFGPTCDSIDVIARSVLLPKLHVGDWLYFQNMGAYTMAAASSFNGFTPTEKFYVCSVQPEYFEKLIAGPEPSDEEKKEE